MVFSYLLKARSEGSVLEVCWPIDQECNGHFLDVFHPLKDMVFTDDDSDLDFYGFEPCPGYGNVSDYSELTPLDSVLGRVRELRSKMSRYSAVHVRRTDKLDPIKAPWFVNTEDVIFFDFIDLQVHRSVFLASDCRETQEAFKRRYGDRMFFSSEIKPSENLRQTSLFYAVADLLLCIRAEAFFGTPKSGFTKFIELNRARRRIKIL